MGRLELANMFFFAFLVFRSLSVHVVVQLDELTLSCLVRLSLVRECPWLVRTNGGASMGHWVAYRLLQLLQLLRLLQVLRLILFVVVVLLQLPNGPGQSREPTSSVAATFDSSSSVIVCLTMDRPAAIRIRTLEDQKLGKKEVKNMKYEYS
ncbi:hypothetical protein FS842_009271 [Serendipita sp. 407]|nr:hypothetical protein FS842_009271 [Serendipita sp. 407]